MFEYHRNQLLRAWSLSFRSSSSSDSGSVGSGPTACGRQEREGGTGGEKGGGRGKGERGG